jgi:hypothetical protein
MIDNEDVDVTERVLRSADHGCRSGGISEIGFDMRYGAACLLQLGENCRQPARVRVLVTRCPRVDEDPIASGQQPATDREADPISSADAGHDGRSRHAANLLALWMSCHAPGALLVQTRNSSLAPFT